MPEIECKIVDPETGAELPDNVTGEFVARGYNIMKGYYKMPKATQEAIDKDGWLHTGDLACRTPEGNYRITEIGQGDPAMMPVRIWEKSVFGKSGCSSMAINMVGTPWKAVIFS